jgi:hypothetical protein
MPILLENTTGEILKVNTEKRIMLPRGDKQYLYDIHSIVPEGTIWVAFKYNGELHRIELGGKTGLAQDDGSVVSLDGLSWNELLYTAMVDSATGELLSDPKFRVAEPIKMGVFDDVFRVGYDIRPMNYHIDFNNNPIIVRKGNKR